jgi:hypothetical protein
LKIYHDIKETIFKFDTGVNTFYFSSELNMKKFRDKIIENRKRISDSLSNRFNMAIDNYNLSDVVLYRKIEKRGFLIMNEKGEILEWPNQIRFVGDQLTKKQLPILQEDSTQR